MVALAFAQAAGAAVVTYAFAAPSTNTFNPQAATTVEPNVTASAFAPILNGVASSSVDASTGMGFSGTGKNAYLGSNNLGFAVPGDDYWSFTLTPTSGSITYQNIVFDTVAPAFTAGSVNWDVRSSQNGFATSLGVVNKSVSSNATLANTIDISSLGSVSSPVEFRIYNYASAGSTITSASQMRVDNVGINVPEPGTVGLLSLAGLAALARRRARTACSMSVRE